MTLSDRIKQMLEKYPRMRTAGGYWVAPTKKMGEVEAVRKLEGELRKNGIRDIHCVKPHLQPKGEDEAPPDCFALSENNERIGIEVTEFVEGDLIPHNIKADDAYRAEVRAATSHEGAVQAFRNHQGKFRDWTFQGLCEELVRIVIKKRRKGFDPEDGPYAERWLLINTDEVGLPPCYFDDQLKAWRIPVDHPFDAIFLMWSYVPWDKGMGDPWGGSHPVVQLWPPSPDLAIEG